MWRNRIHLYFISSNNTSKVYDTEKVVIDADGIVLNKTYSQLSVPLNVPLQEFIIKDMECGTLSNLTFDQEPWSGGE